MDFRAYCFIRDRRLLFWHAVSTFSTREDAEYALGEQGLSIPQNIMKQDVED